MDKIDELVKQVGELLRGAFSPKVEVTKSVDTEQRRALFVAMEPDVEDAHGDITSVEEVEKACNNFNQHCNVANLFHLVETEDAIIQQSFIAPVDMQIDDRFISKGTWLQWWHFPETDTGDVLWDMVKSGEINGISIGALATVEDIE